jgi:hypothetical protein
MGTVQGVAQLKEYLPVIKLSVFLSRWVKSGPPLIQSEPLRKTLMQHNVIKVFLNPITVSLRRVYPPKPIIAFSTISIFSSPVVLLFWKKNNALP